MGKETLLNLYTGLPVRKNFALKTQLDWIVIHLQAGGLWHKWNEEQFIPQVRKQIFKFVFYLSDLSKRRKKNYSIGSPNDDPFVLCTLPACIGFVLLLCSSNGGDDHSSV